MLLTMAEAAAINSEVTSGDSTAHRLEKAIAELRALHQLLLSGAALDPRILTDFRDALNRVRNTAWSAHQYMAFKATDQDSSDVLSILTAERVRVAYQMCRALQQDLKSSEIDFEVGQLIQLHLATKALTEQFAKVIGNLE